MNQTTYTSANFLFFFQKYISEADSDKKRYKQELHDYQNSDQYKEFMQKNANQGEGHIKNK